MITYKDIRPGDTFERRLTDGSTEVRRILYDGTSELVARIHEAGEESHGDAVDEYRQEAALEPGWAELQRLVRQLNDLVEQLPESAHD